MAKKQAVSEIVTVDEQPSVVYWKCNYPIAWIEYMVLREKANVEQVNLGKPIVIVPHAVDVVKS